MIDGDIKISVIIPVYNECREYLEDCVFSICNQTYKNLEIILVDDGSTFSCGEMCDGFRKIDKRIKVFHKENGGSQSARRRGIEEASGDYVAFVDSDDWIELELYEKMADVIRKDKSDMLVASNYYRNYKDGTAINATSNKRIGFWKNSEFEKEVFAYFIKTEEFFDTDFPVAMWTYLFKIEFARVITQKIDDNIKTSEDYTFVMCAFLNAKTFSSIKFRGYHYRSNANSKTNTLKNLSELLRPVYESVNDFINETDYNQEVLKRKNRFFIFHTLMLRDYKSLIDMEKNFLFPYSGVIRGSKILIYGIGRFGKELYKVIRDCDDFEISGVADQNWKFYKEQGGYNVISPEEILQIEFDYVIIAITYMHIREKIKENLIKMGVPEKKIAEIDMNLLDEKHLPI